MACFLLAAYALVGQGKPPTYAPPSGYVPDAATALAVGRAVLIPVYGKATLAREEPFRATLRKGVWMVLGSLPEGAAGGVAEVLISKRTGAILRMIHGK